ncbi:MAG: HupE/UreJ family protein [Gemmatimonadetes bacterium]|jgi:hypothetical protein|nr:HupE/UreJ family protein [Gemmatimonadota bacterium]MBT5055802.1 HupE/UreJ family protein [Gemmatimonadota bacterium]MBT5143717.1 HupE/UreJ family protein [Gemmatimonadota bacterium]MBT5590484.1 HupE/UreJ family protein [Gemmatimonadota bacterium]MBT5965645.1 HupE/UreJ family protein [Gemmatimonadota bacterium]
MNSVFSWEKCVVAITPWWVAMLLLLPLASDAHEINTSYSALTLKADEIRVVLSIDEADLLRLDPQIDANGDGVLWRDEVEAGGGRVAQLLRDRVQVQLDDVAIGLKMQDASPDIDGDGNLFLRAVYAVPTTGEPRELVLDLSLLLQPPLLAEHKNLVRFRVDALQPELLSVLSAASPEDRFQLREEVDLLAQVGHFIWLGIEHIFVGYDHIMFLAALIVIGSRLGPLVKIVSAFTVAHSITLILAALDVVTLPTRWVEAGIALSIAYVALENFWIRDSKHRWLLTFGFGFVHGFGFANVLRDLGLPSEGLIASLLAFNIGVEMGQIVIVAIMLPVILLAARRGYQRRLIHIASAIILLFGVGWFVERLFGLSYMPI